ncbi:MAG: metallophosphoesterase family protein [Bacilli bacterium]|nr:metallophosphoesterase family protein [Bacilli bacterium]
MEEKLSRFIELTKKEISLDEVCEELEITKIEALGFKKEAKEAGYNIVSEQKNGDLIVYNQGEINNSKEDNFEFKSDENNEFKFIAISNTLLGSKSQQLSILKDIYKKAKDEGITKIFVCGNLSAGTYSLKSAYHDTNFISDKENQINYIIENYPKEEGITTYFVTDKKEEGKISVGKRVSEARSDMVYLGSASADIKVDNVKMKIISSPIQQTYTVSYRPQQFAKSFRSEDKPDILLLGGLNQLDHITYREVNVLSIPSLAATTKEMEDKRRSNTIGAMAVKVTTDKTGKIDKKKGVIFTSIPYYVTDKNDYKRNAEPIIMTSSSSAINNDEEIGRAEADRYFNLMKNNRSVEEFKSKHHMSDAEFSGVLELCNMYGKTIDIGLNKDGVPVFKKGIPSGVKLNKPDLSSSDIVENEFLIVSDTHLCNNHQQLHLLNNLYQEAYDRGIDTVLHVGDIVDGFYPNRKPYPSQQFLYDFNDQADYVINMYPYVNGITTYYITGNHDMTHYRNGGASIDHWIGKDRKDMIHLGQDLGQIEFDNVKYRLDHPGDGSADSLSYKIQKRLEIINSGDKPNIYLCGHYHKGYYMLYRNVHAFTCPALCATTSFEHQKGLNNYLGGFFITVYSDKKTGNVEYLAVEEKLYGKKDIWDEPGKDRNKVKQLVIK